MLKYFRMIICCSLLLKHVRNPNVGIQYVGDLLILADQYLLLLDLKFADCVLLAQLFNLESD